MSGPEPGLQIPVDPIEEPSGLHHEPSFKFNVTDKNRLKGDFSLLYLFTLTKQHFILTFRKRKKRRQQRERKSDRCQENKTSRNVSRCVYFLGNQSPPPIPLKII